MLRIEFDKVKLAIMNFYFSIARNSVLNCKRNFNLKLSNKKLIKIGLKRKTFSFKSNKIL